jgi:hypothetical protein
MSADTMAAIAVEEADAMAVDDPVGSADQPAADPSILSPAELEALGIKTQDEVQTDAWARCLLLGAMKIGKTTSLLTTAPGPILVLNCDGQSATVPAARMGGKFLQLDIRTRSDLQRHTATACALAEKGQVRTIILDTVTLLADNIVKELKPILGGDKNKYAIWDELKIRLQTNIQKLLYAYAHVFIVAHLDPRSVDLDNCVAGILPMIPGDTKTWLPSTISDWVLCESDYDDAKAPVKYLVGPQKYWTHSGRNIKRSVIIPADVKLLLAEFGINP